jgi:hypothetical protein
VGLGQGVKYVSSQLILVPTPRNDRSTAFIGVRTKKSVVLGVLKEQQVEVAI